VAARFGVRHCTGSVRCSMEESEYFASYASTAIHRDMLQDRARTLAYRNAIAANASRFKDAVVLDVGAGSGILSLFAAQLGAKRVWAVEASELALKTQEIVHRNALEDVISVQHCKVEDLVIEGLVDIIISEWMGYFLIYETMLPSVIFARDKWLKPNGLMFPSKAMLYMTPIRNDVWLEENYLFWQDVYGFDFSDLRAKHMLDATREALTEDIRSEDVIGEKALVLDLDLYSISHEDSRGPWSSQFTCQVFGSCTCIGWASWFDVVFPGGSILSTSPDSEPTHWAQTLFLMSAPVQVEQDDEIQSKIAVAHTQDSKRVLRVVLEMEIQTGSHSVKRLKPDKKDAQSSNPILLEYILK